MKLKYILPFLLAILSIACFDDETTVDTRIISVISIDTAKLQKEYNIDKNVTQIITPEITQNDPVLPLTYEWQVDYKFYSDSSAFKYTGENLGSYHVRLKVSNDDGSSFYTFKLNVNSPYEEGITVLSEGADGEMQLSFMRKFTDEELATGAVEKFETHCLEINNPGYRFAKSPSDMAKREKQLFISCKNAPTVYAINTKTFELENAISAPEYPDFVPLKMNISDNGAKNSLTLCENGVIYNLATLEGLILPEAGLTSKYAKQMFFYQTVNGNYNYLWDTEESKVYCYMSSWNVKDSKDLLAGHDLIQFFHGVYGDYITLITRNRSTGAITKTNIGCYFIAYNEDYTESWLDLREQTTLSGEINLTPTSPSVSSSAYKQLLYAVGNKIYRWYFSDSSFPTTPWATIDLPGAEITTLGLSPDEKQLYVGVYQFGEPGQNGHVYILNSDTGKPIGTPYLNVANKPVKVMYKVK